MFLAYEYLVTLVHGAYKVELYDTGRRRGLFRNKVVAFQLFYDNRLISEHDNCVIPGILVNPKRIWNSLPVPNQPELPYEPSFEVVEVI